MILEKAKKVIARKGWAYFTRGLYNLNIIGIRSTERRAGSFDDTLIVSYKDSAGERFKLIKFTADAGVPWLKKPFVKNGTAVMLPYQYRGVYKRGIHGRSWASGGYEALEQKGPMLYIRDGNKDSIIDLPLFHIDKDPATQLREQGKTIYRGNIKTNIHRASKNSVKQFIGTSSAGCQVVQDPCDFEWLMDIVRKSISYGWGNSFTYTLLHEEWINQV